MREMYSLRIFYAAQCSGLHVFQFSSDYSPLHEELTKQNKTKQNNNQRKPSMDEPVKILEE